MIMNYRRNMYLWSQFKFQMNVLIKFAVICVPFLISMSLLLIIHSHATLSPFFFSQRGFQIIKFLWAHNRLNEFSRMSFAISVSLICPEFLRFCLKPPRDYVVQSVTLCTYCYCIKVTAYQNIIKYHNISFLKHFFSHDIPVITVAGAQNLNCNFEKDFCLWTQVDIHHLTWSRSNGPTTSMSFAPMGDHTTGSKKYKAS